MELPTADNPACVVEGDALDVLPRLPDGCVNAVVTDPPYNVGFAYKGDESGDRKADYAEWCATWFTELKRVTRGAILVSCGVANLGVWHRIEQPRWVMCWWKPASSGRCVVGFNNWEPILVYGKPPRNVCDVLRTTEQASLPVNHKKIPIDHPCPKPVEWAARQIRAATKPDDTVLDPFLGSGTTALAALAEGRRCVGVERIPEYAAVARKRVAEAMGKTGLFAETASA